MIEEEIISQEPVQQPPYKKKVFDILSSNFDDFKLGEQDFYKKLATDKNYAGKVHDVLIQNFSDFKKPKNEFIDSLTFEEPLKKKDGGEISSPTKLQFPSLDTKLFGEAAIKPVSESTNFGNADIVDKTKMMESLPFVKDKAIHDKTIKNLLQQGKLAMEGSNSYKEEKQNVANTLADEEWMPSAIRPAEKDYIKNKAIKDFSAYNKEDAGVIQQKLDNGDYLLENGKIKIRGGIADNFGQGVKDFIDNVGLSLNVAAAQSRGNNNEVKYYMNEFFKDKEKDKEFAAVSLPEKASKVIGEMSPYAIAGAVMPYADIPLMGMSNLASNHQAIWDDPKLTMDEKVNAIYNTSQDAFMTGNLQGAAFHSLGITDEKVAKELLSKYQPTQKLYNTFKDVIKTLPSDVSKVAAIGGGTEVLNNLTKNKAGIKVDFSTVPEGALSLATLELIMKAPKVFVSGFKTINEAVRTGYDKENPNWYNGYSKNVQDVLNQIVASPEPVYKKLINLLDVHPDAESNLAKQKIETFRDYYKSLPADLDQTQKNKALHILQLKTEAIADSKNAQDPTIRKALENKSNAYDKILQKVIDKESVKEGEEPLLSSRFAKPTLQEEEPAIKVEPIEEVKLTEVEEIPVDLEEKGEPIESTLEAERRRSNGERIFAITEQDGTPIEVTSVEMLRNYTPDQLLAYKPIEVKENKLEPIEFSKIIEDKYGIIIDLTGDTKKGDLTLSRIEVPKEQRGKEVGTKAMEDIIKYADENNKRIVLTPSTDFGGTSVKRLKEFYKKFGFIENTGKNKDFTTKETMYRNPEVKPIEIKAEVEPSIETDIKTQIEDFGVPKENVEPVNTMLSNIYESLKKSGLTATNTLSEWVGIGRGTKEKGALFQPTIYGKSGIIKRPSFDKASADKAIKSGRVKVISPKKSLEDLTFAITHWDDLFVGDIFHNDKKIGSFDGGVFYPLNGGEKGKMGASVNPQSAGAFATQSNRSLFKNNGIKLPESFDEGTFVIEKGSNKNEWILTNKAGEKVTVNLPDNPKPGVVVIGKGDNLKHKSSLSAKVGFVNTLLSYAKGKEGYDGLINAIKSVYSIGNTRNADSVIDLFNNYLKSGRMADGQTMSEAKTSYENFRAALIKDANPIITSMMRDMGYTEAEYFDGTQLKKGIYKATGKGIDKMFADLGQEDFLKGLKTGDAYAALKVTSPVFFEKDLSHPSYPFAIKTIDSSPVNIDIFNKTFRTFGENQGIEGRLPKEGQTVTEGFGVTTTTKPSFKIKQDIDLSHPSSIDLSGALGQYESVQRTQSLKQKANAQYRIESGKNIIEALRAFNKAKDKGKAVVAITHEIMHPTVVEIISGAKDGNEIGKKHTQTIVDEFNKATGNKITVDELISGNDEFRSGKTTKQYRDVQEFIAESWEKYHTQGAKGFSAEFQKVLETITEAFKTVYKSLTGKELTPELRRMFDDILGKSEFKSEYEKQLLSEGKSKKRQENVRKTIIDSNFDQIVKDLIRNNKIEKIC